MCRTSARSPLHSRSRRAVWAALASLLVAGAAGARTLTWDSMTVEARLDGEGRLHVVEQQAMRFDGDWNGGERGFRLRGGQRIELHRLTRFDPATGVEIDLVEGDLDEVDHFGWVDRTTLRWRSRLPSDPPFVHQMIGYRLTYTLSGVLREVDGRYLLDHDFAFTDREGAIDRFELELQLDPVWQAPGDLALRQERSALGPGQGVVVTANLSFLGENRPASVPRTLPRWIGIGLSAGSLAVMVGLFVVFLSAETRHGRFASPEIPEPIDAGWIEANVLTLLPEQVGALWDNRIGAPEVAALIARLVAEGKLASSVQESGRWFGGRVLTLELRVDRSEFHGYERALIRKLFFDHRSTTDTEAIRKHYRSQGFSPAKVISTRILQRLGSRPEAAGGRPAPSWKPTAILFLAFFILLLLEALTRGLYSGLAIVGIALFTVFPGLLGWGFSGSFSRRISHYLLGSLGFIVPALVIWAVCLGAGVAADPGESGEGPGVGLIGLLALALLPVVIFHSFLNWARSRESKATIHQRQRLAAARKWFRAELKRDRPALRDTWFPYLLALGLGKSVDRWFGEFGHEISLASGSTSSSFGGGTPVSGSAWTGGGGAFGGGGASAAWGAAVSSMAAGVAAPSSSGSSGGGGGGSSSGGGSGGGW